MRASVCAALIALCLAASPAAAQLEGTIPSGRVVTGTLSFDGHATVGDFIGTTTQVTGEMTGGGLAEVRGWVEAPVGTLDTGNKKRDRDLNKSMESDKYPTIRFELTGVAPTRGAAGSVATTLMGRMTLHGVTREVSLPAEIRAVSEGIRVRSDFPLNLKEYEIGGLSKMLGMLKMQEDIEVRVDLTFAPQ
jgi:polyisoprenoid-binding protein YceI